MFKKQLPIIFIGLCVVVAVLVLSWAVFVKTEMVVPVQVPVVDDEVISAFPIKEIIVSGEEIIASKEELPKEVSHWKNPIKVFISPKPTYEEHRKRCKEMHSDRETYTDNVCIKDERTNKEIILMRLNNVYCNHYHLAEYHNGHLYIIKEFYDYDHTHTHTHSNLRRELWKYDLENNKEKLFSARGIDFRVDPKEKFIAVNNLILDLNNGETKLKTSIDTLIHPDLLEYNDEYGLLSVGLVQWSSNGKYFWGNLAVTASISQFFKINTENWQITKYDVSSLLINLGESALNPDIEKVVYSDAPVFFDTEDSDEFKQSGKQVTLYLYDLNSKKSKIIDKTVADWFKPEWIDNSTIEYTKNGKRITLKVI